MEEDVVDEEEFGLMKREREAKIKKLRAKRAEGAGATSTSCSVQAASARTSAKAGGAATEMLKSIRTVAALGLEEVAERRYNEALKQVEAAGIYKWRQISCMPP